MSYYCDEETKKRARRESRIFEGGDYVVGILFGALVGFAMFAVTMFTDLFSKDLVIHILDSTLDLRPLAAPGMGILAGAAGMLAGMYFSKSRREKKNDR